MLFMPGIRALHKCPFSQPRRALQAAAKAPQATATSGTPATASSPPRQAQGTPYYTHQQGPKAGAIQRRVASPYHYNHPPPSAMPIPASQVDPSSGHPEVGWVLVPFGW